MRLIKTHVDLMRNPTEHCVYLGTWCFKNDPDIIEGSKRVEIIPYHWNNRVKFRKDFEYLTKTYESLLCDLSECLNQIHGTSYDKEYWRVAIGSWLRQFVDIVFDRYETVRLASQQGKKLQCIVYNYNKEELALEDSAAFYKKSIGDEWNEFIFSECLKYFDINITLDERTISCREDPPEPLVATLKRMTKNLLGYIGMTIPDVMNRIVIISAYTSLWNVARLQLKLAQLPYLAPPTVNLMPSTKIDKELRKQIKLKTAKIGFEQFLFQLIPWCIPKVYVEAFKPFKQSVLSKYPKNPKKIITANAYQGNDAFTIWAAEQKLKGAELLIAQHGGNFGNGLFSQTEDHQLKIADRFLSWGWKRQGFKNIFPVPSINLSSSTIKQNNAGDITYVLAAMPRYFYSSFAIPIAGQYINYLNNQIDLLGGLNADVLENVKLRPDSSGEFYGWNIKGVFAQHGFEQNIDTDKRMLKKRLNDARLCICTHNATVFLETLSANFPTLIFWNPEFYEVRSEAKASFYLLESVGILHYNHRSASDLINMNFDDFMGWWLQSDIQNARKAFIEVHAQSSKSWMKSWKEMLIKPTGT